MENWRAIEGFIGLYEVSDLGSVRSLSRRLPDGRLWKSRRLRPISNNRDKYLRVCLHRDGATYARTVLLFPTPKTSRKSTTLTATLKTTAQ